MIEAGCNSGKPDFKSNDDDRGEDELSVVAGGVREAEPPVPEDWMK